MPTLVFIPEPSKTLVETKLAETGTRAHEQAPKLTPPAASTKGASLGGAFKSVKIQKETTEEKMGLRARFKEFFSNTASGIENRLAAGGAVATVSGALLMTYAALTIPSASAFASGSLAWFGMIVMATGSFLMLFSDTIARAAYRRHPD